MRDKGKGTMVWEVIDALVLLRNNSDINLLFCDGKGTVSNRRVKHE